MEIIYHETGRDPLYKIWNTTDENMIIHFRSDGGFLVFRDAIYPIERGGLCFVGTDKLHYTVPSDPSSYDRSKIFLSVSATRALLSSVGTDSAFFKLFSASSVVYAKLPEEADEEAERILSEGMTRFEREGRREALVKAFFELMCLLARYATHHIKAHDGFMTVVIEYINAHYGEKISLDEICRAVNMSKSYFCHRFKSVMGMTVMEYLLTTRLAAAKELLLEGREDIGEISERCGFSSVSYFCQVFKERVGVTAGAYKRGRDA